MYKGSRELDRISPQQLDNYLSRGWFRMNQSIFTTPFLQEGFDFRDAIWLRHHLRQFEYPKRFLKLQQNNFFEIDIKDLSITPQHELLYQKYRESRPIEAPLSLENIIYGDGFNNIYHTKIINLYINDELVGSGILDLGEKAAAGIVNFYDPVYAKYSPGKFLFLLAVQYCQHEGLDFFYPGYFVPGNPHFDYKLDISKPSLNYFDVSSDSWLPIASFREIELPTRLIRVNLMNLNGQLEHIEIPSCFIHNANYFFLKIQPGIARSQPMYYLPATTHGSLQ